MDREGSSHYFADFFSCEKGLVVLAGAENSLQKAVEEQIVA